MQRSWSSCQNFAYANESLITVYPRFCLRCRPALAASVACPIPNCRALSPALDRKPAVRLSSHVCHNRSTEWCDFGRRTSVARTANHAPGAFGRLPASRPVHALGCAVPAAPQRCREVSVGPLSRPGTALGTLRWQVEAEHTSTTATVSDVDESMTGLGAKLLRAARVSNPGADRVECDHELERALQP